MYELYTMVLSSPIQDTKEAKCLSNLTLSLDKYSLLLEMQTKSSLYGSPGDRVLPGHNDKIHVQEKLFGFDSSMCCEKKSKACKRKQKKHMRQIYGKGKRNSFNHEGMQFKTAPCQMKFETDWDIDRVPETILHVKCSCLYPLYFRPKGYICVPVHQFVTVFRKDGCVDGAVTYTESMEKVSVACVLVKEPKAKRPKKIRMKN